jgi:hypothetical protein
MLPQPHDLARQTFPEPAKDMHMHVRHALAAAFCFIVTPVLADPVGRYDVTGTNPSGGSGYSGSVTVEHTGQTYRVVWVVGSQRYEGTAIGDSKFLAISYRSGDQSGLALYGAKGDDWDGIWTYAGGRQIGAERWTRK